MAKENKNNNTKKQKNNRNRAVRTARKSVKAGKKAMSEGASATKVVEAMAAPVVKAVEKKVTKMTEENPSGFLSTVVDGVKSGINWIKEGGWETIATVALSLLDSPSHSHLERYVRPGKVKGVTGYVDGDVIPAGTILLNVPISPDMFKDENDRLQKKLSLYTYYAFMDSQIVYKGSAGITSDGLIGMFIVPDPTLVISTTKVEEVQRLVRQFGGRVVRLDHTASVNIPPPTTALYVAENQTEDPRLETQGTFYAIAMTDIDAAGSLGEFSLKYNVEMAKDANTGLTSVGAPTVGIWQTYAFQQPPGAPNGRASIPSNTTQTYSTLYVQSGVQTVYEYGPSGVYYSSDVPTDGCQVQFYPGVYQMTPGLQITPGVGNSGSACGLANFLFTSLVSGNVSYTFASPFSMYTQNKLAFVPLVPMFFELQEPCYLKINISNTNTDGPIFVSGFLGVTTLQSLPTNGITPYYDTLNNAADPYHDRKLAILDEQLKSKGKERVEKPELDDIADVPSPRRRSSVART